MKLAKVVAVNPGGHAVDLLFLDDGSRVPGVQVMSGSASTNTGTVDLPEPSSGGWDSSASLTGDRDLIAVVGFYRGLPIVQGFLFPQVCQVLFDRKDFKVERHASDVYKTIDKDGNLEVFHPSGTYLRIAENPAHEDLTGADADGKWAITKNTGKAVHIQLTLKNGGAQKFSLNIDPDGNVVLDHIGNFTQNTGGNFIQNVTGNYTLQVGGSYNQSVGTTYNVTAGGAYTLTSASYDWYQG